MEKNLPIENKKAYFKCKQSGEVFDLEEVLSMVDEDDNLDSFISLGEFSSKPTL